MVKRKKSETPSRVYVYGLGEPKADDRDAVFDQLRRAQRYYNDLTALTRAELAALRATQLETPVGHQLRNAEEMVAAIYREKDEILLSLKGERQETRSRLPLSAEDNARLAEVDKKLEDAKEILRKLRKEANDDPIYKKRRDHFAEMAADLRRVTPKYIPGLVEPGARGQCGLYSGTYLNVEAAVDASRAIALGLRKLKTPAERKAFWKPPKMRRWDGTGTLAVQVSGGGIPVSSLFNAKDNRVRIVDEPRFRVTRRHPEGIQVPNSCWLRLRIGSNPDRSPIWATWPMIMHRPLPEDGVVKWVKVIRRKVGLTSKWEAHFTVESPMFIGAQADSSAHAVAVHFHPLGWGSGAEGSTGILVAAALGTDAEAMHMRLARVQCRAKPNGKRAGHLDVQDVLDALAKADEIRGGRDKDFNRIRDELFDWMALRTTPDWLRKATRKMSDWRNQHHMVNLVFTWREHRFDGDASMFEKLEAWRRQDKHLYQWHGMMRQKAIRHRRDLYRCWARKLAEKYSGSLIIEDFDLTKIARRAKTESEETLGEARRWRRTAIAVGELRDALKHAFAGRIIMLTDTKREATCPVCKSKVGNGSCENCIVPPPVWTARCWAMLEEAGYSTLQVRKRWEIQSNQVLAVKAGGASATL